MIQFHSTGTNKGCVWSCRIYNLAKLLWCSPSSISKFIWLQGSYLFKYFPENEKWSHRKKKRHGTLKIIKGVIKTKQIRKFNCPYKKKLTSECITPTPGRLHCFLAWLIHNAIGCSLKSHIHLPPKAKAFHLLLKMQWQSLDLRLTEETNNVLNVKVKKNMLLNYFEQSEKHIKSLEFTYIHLGSQNLYTY